jgi:hypothetical protein
MARTLSRSPGGLERASRVTRQGVIALTAELATDTAQVQFRLACKPYRSLYVEGGFPKWP